jgi:hypothetical protein
MTRSSTPPSDYHGAHKRPATAQPVRRWAGHGCTAFAHDLMSSPRLPEPFAACDVLVTDLPWQKGYEVFNQRAAVADGRSYATFMARVSEIVQSTDVPLYLITGKHAMRYLPAPDCALAMRLNEDAALAIGYRPGPEVARGYGVTQEFLAALARQYGHAGDFCCGYGRTGRFFLRAGKRAVMSDFNPRCIGYIAEHASSCQT